MEVGQIYRHDDFYFNADTRQLETKYFVILAFTPARDVVARLLTSRAHGRPEQPPCYHGDPYPGFYLGVLAPPLGKKSWADLRGCEDFDSHSLQRKLEHRQVSLIASLPANTYAALLDCVANADDTTKLQETSIRNQLASLRQ
ncbi:MAG: hypothetical protein QM808_02330 [Steroidobacteraceae bacterium]